MTQWEELTPLTAKHGVIPKTDVTCVELEPVAKLVGDDLRWLTSGPGGEQSDGEEAHHPEPLQQHLVRQPDTLLGPHAENLRNSERTQNVTIRI